MDVGLTTVQMGVQSGSQRVLDKVYNRTLSIAKVRAAERRSSPTPGRAAFACTWISSSITRTNRATTWPAPTATSSILRRAFG